MLFTRLPNREKKEREKEGEKEEERGRTKRIIIDKRVRRRIQFSWFPTGTIARLVFGGESRRLLGIKVGKKFSRGRRDYRRIASTISGDEQRWRRKRFRRNIDHTGRYTDSESRTRSNRWNRSSNSLLRFYRPIPWLGNVRGARRKRNISGKKRGPPNELNRRKRNSRRSQGNSHG